MPRDASGIFQRLYRWINDRDAGVKIRADRMDEEFNGIVQDMNDVTAGHVPWRGTWKGLNGTAALPAYTFDEDQDTGMFRKAADELGFAVGGVEVMSVTPSGITQDELAFQRQIWPLGAIQALNTSALKAGWILGQGQALGRETYADYFSLVGETYGAGDGSTTFNVPDLSGRTMIAASTTYPLGSTGGSSEMPQHRHSFSVSGSGSLTYYQSVADQDRQSGFGDGTGAKIGVVGVYNSQSSKTASFSFSDSGNTGYAGSSGSTDNMQPYFAANFAIFVGA